MTISAATPSGVPSCVLDAAEHQRLWSAVTRRTDRARMGLVMAHLTSPVTPARELAGAHGVTVDDVRAAYRFCREDPAVADLVNSPYYPHRLRHRFAAAMIEDWRKDPHRVARLRRNEAVVSRTVEIHPTRGSCNYRCSMCLWSDQDLLTYRTQRLDTDGLLGAARWCELLDQLRDDGVTRVVISGGGEALLNPDLAAIIAHARALGLDVEVYTTGFAARPDSPVFEALTSVSRVRFSIHSPDPVTYDLVAGTDPRKQSLHRVSFNVAALLSARPARPVGSAGAVPSSRGPDGPRVGIGFVIQPSNHHQITRMVTFADHLGVDWLDLRKDEVDVTDGLNPDQLAALGVQLRAVRATSSFRRVEVDLADELVTIANRAHNAYDTAPADDESTRSARAPQCRARYFRPTISPYGQLAPCDLMAEPRFANTAFGLGSVRRLPIASVLHSTADRHIPDACEQCMPSSRTGNLVLHKLLTDLDAGVTLDQQPF